MRSFVLAAITSCFALSANAAFIDHELVGISEYDVLLDFPANQYPNSTEITDQFSSSGVTFGTIDRQPFQYRTFDEFEPGLLSGGYLFLPFDNATPGRFLFSQDVSAASFLFRTNPRETTFGAYLDGELVEGATVTTGRLPVRGDAVTDGYFGFSGIVFDEIRFVVGGPGPSRQAAIDNLAFNFADIAPPPGCEPSGFRPPKCDDFDPAVVPLPASLPLLMAGVAGLVFWRRKKRHI